MTLKLRRALKGDAPAVFALLGAAAAHLRQNGVDMWDVNWYPNERIVEEDIAQGCMTVGEMDGAIVLSYVLNTQCDEAYQHIAWRDPAEKYLVLHRLCVDPARQGQGLARQALLAVEEEARARGVASLRLDVFCENPRAVTLYEKAGYAARGQARFYKGLFSLMEKNLC